MASFFFTLNYVWNLYTAIREKYHSCSNGYPVQVRTHLTSPGFIGGQQFLFSRFCSDGSTVPLCASPVRQRADTHWTGLVLTGSAVVVAAVSTSTYMLFSGPRPLCSVAASSLGGLLLYMNSFHRLVQFSNRVSTAGKIRALLSG